MTDEKELVEKLREICADTLAKSELNWMVYGHEVVNSIEKIIGKTPEYLVDKRIEELENENE